MRTALAALVLLATPLLTSASSVEIVVAPGNTPIFSPPRISIRTGDTVVFRWGAESHDVTQGDGCTPADPMLFKLVAKVGGTAAYTFERAGNYGIFSSTGNDCQSGMKGVVSVTGETKLTPSDVVASPSSDQNAAKKSGACGDGVKAVAALGAAVGVSALLLA